MFLKKSLLAVALGTALTTVALSGCNSTTANTTTTTATTTLQGIVSPLPATMGEDGRLYDSVAPANSVYIWPGERAPNDTSTAEEKITQRAAEGQLSDRMYTGTQKPQLAFYYPPQDKANGIGLILFPGGAYVRTVIDKEGEVLAPVFAQMGYTVAVLNYRLPQDHHVEGADAPLADAQRAIRVMRSMAGQLNLKEVGIMGFSAGGSLAGLAATCYTRHTYDKLDVIDDFSARPDFAAMIYPVASMQDGITHQESRMSLIGENPSAATVDAYSADKQVNDYTVPTFLVHAVDDPDVPVQNSLLMFNALKAHNIPTEMHLFGEGAHGFGLRNVQDKPAGIWPTLFYNWQQRLDATQAQK